MTKLLVLHEISDKDTLGFQIKISDKASIQYGKLALFSSVYNPLSSGATFLSTGRLIFQYLCKNSLNWDGPIDDSSGYESFMHCSSYLENHEFHDSQVYVHPTTCAESCNSIC